MSKASVYSIYFENIDNEVVKYQRLCVNKFLPQGWTFYQIWHSPKDGDLYPHAHAMEKCVQMNTDDLTVFLDIDCIPLSEKALPYLAQCVTESEGHTGLAGAIQRSNHIENKKHLYVGPFCMAFSKAYYERIRRPSFTETIRGDVGEELTYRWIESGGRNYFIWPTDCIEPRWDLIHGFRFGLGTTYGNAKVGQNLFYHSFNARDQKTREMFISKCMSVLNQRKEIEQCALSA